jgi:hypothetical protein
MSASFCASVTFAPTEMTSPPAVNALMPRTTPPFEIEKAWAPNPPIGVTVRPPRPDPTFRAANSAAVPWPRLTMTILDAARFASSQLTDGAFTGSARVVATPPVRGLISATDIALHELGGFADPAVEADVGVEVGAAVGVDAFVLVVVDVVLAVGAVLPEVADLLEDPQAATSSGPASSNATMGGRR